MKSKRTSHYSEKIKKQISPVFLEEIFPIIKNYMLGLGIEKIGKEEHIFYHYTKYDGLKGIIENKQLWFTYSEHLNDPTEVHIGKELIKRELSNFNCRTISFEYFLKSYFLPEFERILKNLDVYILSGCLEPDNLSCWRWYGDNTEGFVLGFKDKIFNLKDQDGTYIKIPCLIAYDDKCPADAIQELLKKTQSLYIRFSQRKTKRKNFLLFQEEFARQFMIWLMPFLAGIKDKNFSPEKEARCFIVIGRDECEKFKKITSPFRKSDNEEKAKFLKPKHSAKRLLYPFELDELVEIHVGVGCIFEEAKKSIILLLETNEINCEKIKIIYSKLPYRS